MSAESPFLALERLPAVIQWEIDRLAWEFEQQHQRNASPALDGWIDRLSDNSPDAQNALLRELLVVDISFGRARGLVASRDRYVSAFPNAVELVDELLGSTRNGTGDHTCGSLATRISPVGDEDSTAKNAGSISAMESSFVTVVPARPAAPSRVIRRIGPYRILRTLGEGGMGTVYLAEPEEKPGRLVALKTIRESVADPSHYARFMREIESLKQLRHPQIVPYLGAGDDGGTLYFAMEFIAGRNLKEATETTWEPKDAAALTEKLARAMDHVHERAHVVHRDLKPQNVLLDERGEPHITDFGLAKQLDDAGADFTRGQIIGTPSYMAPEQADGSGQSVTVFTDVYALGGILYFLLVMKPPFLAPSVEQIVCDVLTKDPVPPRRIDPSIPEQIERICLKCLEKEPEKRYASAHELAEELRRFRTGERLLTRPLSWARRLARLARRHRQATAILGATFLVLVATLASISWGLVATRQERDRTEQQRAKTEKQLHETERANYRATLQKVELSRQQGIPIAPGIVPDWLAGWETDWLRQESMAQPRKTLVFSGHDWPVLNVAVSPDGKQVVTCGADGQLLLFDVPTGRQVRKLDNARPARIPLQERYLHYAENLAVPEEGKVQNHYYCAAVWLGKSSRIAAVTLNGSVKVIDTQSGGVQELFNDGTEFYAVAANAEGTRILVGGPRRCSGAFDPAGRSAAAVFEIRIGCQRRVAGTERPRLDHGAGRRADRPAR